MCLTLQYHMIHLFSILLSLYLSFNGHFLVFMQGEKYYLGGAQSCRVQSKRVPTYVLFRQVTLTTSMPVDDNKKAQQCLSFAY